MRTLGAFWLYTLLRIGLFGVLWVVLWLVGVETILAAIIALAVSVPLSWFLLARPRQALAGQIEQRVEQRRVKAGDLDARLAGDAPEPSSAKPAATGPAATGPATAASDSDDPLPPGVSEAPARGRSKRR